MRKVKFTQENFDERLKGILDEFPKLDVGGFFVLPPKRALQQHTTTPLSTDPRPLIVRLSTSLFLYLLFLRISTPSTPIS